jgi:hypothetical protein
MMGQLNRHLKPINAELKRKLWPEKLESKNKMNERIQELAQQATTYIEPTSTSGEGWIFDKEKFAELIIKETLQVARAGVEFGNGMEDAVYNYFGVEL